MTEQMKGTKRSMNTGAFKRVLLALVVLLVASAALVGAGSAADAGTDVVAKIGDKDYTSLAEALEDAKTSNNGAVIVLQKDLTLDPWTAVAMGSVSFTLDGNHHTISGLSQPLFEYIGWNGVTVTIKNLTIDKPQITTYGGPKVGESAALAAYVGTSKMVDISGCTVSGGTISGKYVGALVGYTEGSGSVVNINECIVDGVTLDASGSVGLFIGHSYSNGSITGTVRGTNSISCSDESYGRPDKVGIVIGRPNGGTLDVSVTVTGTNSLNPVGTNTQRTFGSLPGNPVVVIIGGSYPANPTLVEPISSGNTPTVKTGYTIVEEGGKWILKVKNPVAEISGTGYLTLKDAINDATNGDTVKLLQDTTEAKSGNVPGINVPAGKEITIDLNGKTLTGDIYSEGDLTVKNGTINSEQWVSAIESYGDSANLTVDDLTVTSKRHALRIDGGEATIISGTYTTTGRTGMGDTAHALNAGSGDTTKTTVTVAGGTFNGIDYLDTAETGDSGAAVNAQYNTIVYLKGGEYSGGQNYVLRVTDGGEIQVTGGKYDQDPSAMGVDSSSPSITNHVVAGYEVKQSGNWYTVSPIPPVAEVNGVTYIDLQTAIDNANDGDTVKLLANIELEAKDGTSGKLTPLINISTDITLDMSGKKINLTQPSATSVIGMPLILNITDGAKVTITGNGIIDAECGDNAVYGMRILDGTVTIESGSFTGAATVAQVTKGELIINGGSFDMAETYKSKYSQYYKYLLNCIDANYKDGSAKITIKGGKFTGFNPANNEAEGAGTNFVAEGYEVAENGNVYTVSKIQPASKPSSSGSSGSSVWLTETPTPTPTPSVTPTETETAPTDIPSTQPTDVESPGFGVLAVLAGLGAVAVLRRK